MAEPLRVFVSSTSEDLEVYRAAVQHAIGAMQWAPVMMENFGARSGTTVGECKAAVEKCDLMVLLVAFRQGWVPGVDRGGNGVDSITALELKHAEERKIPVLAFLANENWPRNLSDTEPEKIRSIEGFRKGLDRVADFFEFDDEGSLASVRMKAFRTKVHQALLNHREQLLAHAAPPSGDDSARVSEMAQTALLAGSCVPFVGPGIFGQGPLGPGSLASALSHQAGQPAGDCVATAAEYCERFALSRETFLENLRSIVEAQAREDQGSAVHDLIAGARLKPPGLIVSGTLDLQLENRLEAAGKRVIIVSHVLRSVDGEHDGKILVLRPGAAPEICPADQLDLDGAECVVYKPLGSPLLHAKVDPALELDTVVITETDHLLFLGRLEHQHTKVPARFHRVFQKWPTIFLGYPMDVWHYRMVMQVFESVGMRGPGASTRARPIAVRQPANSMEDFAWKRLGADRLDQDPNAFARGVVAKQAEGAPHEH